MKFGMPTLVEYETLEQSVERCAELGLHFVEMNMNLPICTPVGVSSKKLQDLQRQYGIAFTIHLPEEMDMGSFQPEMRRGHVEACKNAMRWASEAGIRTLNMHLNKGIYFTLPDTKVWIYERYEALFTDALKRSYDELYPLAEELGVRLCIENTNNFHLPFIRGSLEQLASSSEFRLTWDVGHDAVAEFQEEPVFRSFADRVAHMHMHDFNGKKDHQPLFSGIVPIEDRLAFARERDLTVVIEVKTSESLGESVRRLRERGL